MADIETPVKGKTRHKRPAQKFIFRSLKTTDPVLLAELRRLRAQPKTYLKLEDSISWPYKNVNGKRIPLPLDTDMSEIEKDEADGTNNIMWLPRTIRYVHGLNTPFADEQEAEQGTVLRRENGQNPILDNPMNRDAVVMVMHELKLPSSESVLANYIWLMNQCQNQHPKARRRGTSKPEFYKVDFGELDQAKVNLGKLREKSYKLAQTASLEEMIPHASHLGIAFVIPETGEDRDWDAIREDYKDKALANPALFDQTYGDPRIKMMHVIRTLQENGKLSIHSITAGQAHWTDTRKLITVLPPDRNPIEFLAEFSLMKEGDEFAKQMVAYRRYTEIKNA